MFFLFFNFCLMCFTSANSINNLNSRTINGNILSATSNPNFNLPNYGNYKRLYNSILIQNYTNKRLNENNFNTQSTSISNNVNLNSSMFDNKESEQRLYLGQAHIQFTLDLLSNILMRESYNQNEQVVNSFNFSPVNLQTLLMLFHLASNGNTRSQIESVLYLENIFNLDKKFNNRTSEDFYKRLNNDNHYEPYFFNNNNLNENASIPLIHKIYSQLINNLFNDKQLTDSLSSTSKIFYKKDILIKPSFKNIVDLIYQKPLKQIDFSNQLETLRIINDFVLKETKGLVKNFLTVPPSSTSSFVGLNVIYFQSNWKYKFDPRDTENNALFYNINSKKTFVSMMIGKFPVAYAYSKNLKCSIVELPYKISRISMFILLPENVNGFFNLIRNLNASSLTDLIASMRKTIYGVNVRIPKFEIETQLNLANVLNNLGIRSLFSSGECDLKNMILNNDGNFKDIPQLNGVKLQTNNINSINPIYNQINPTINQIIFSNPVHINDFTHKAILKVDESGSVGAGVSGAIIERIGIFTGAYFEADHPFIYFLTDKQTGLILFAGVFANSK